MAIGNKDRWWSRYRFASLSMFRPMFVLMTIVLLGATGSTFFWWQQSGRDSEGYTLTLRATPTPVATVIPPIPIPTGRWIVVDARVVPARSAELSFSTRDSAVAELLVQEGDQVERGAPLIRLDTRALQLRIEQAHSSLARAQADYDRLVEGATAPQIAQAQAQVAQAQARLQQAQGSVTAEDLVAAEARLEEARTRLAELEAGPKQTEIEMAQATLDRARVHLRDQQISLSASKTVGESRIEQAANDLRDAQTTYSQIYWEVRELENHKPNELMLREAQNREEIALRAVSSAEHVLEQARVAADEAWQTEITGIQSAEAQVRDAQARLDQLLAGADADVLATARAEVAAAAATLTRLQGEARAGSIAAAQADVSDAQARLNDLTAAPRPADIARVAAAIQQAQVDLRQSELALEQATLTAPMAGVVAAINIKVGEIPTGTMPVMVLADLSSWQLETEGLTDLSIVRVRDGAPAIISFYALPGVELHGIVQRVKPLGVNEQGETTYIVVVTPDEWDERLRWNMIAQVSIEPGE